jgi:hypothetical protein
MHPTLPLLYFLTLLTLQILLQFVPQFSLEGILVLHFPGVSHLLFAKFELSCC